MNGLSSNRSSQHREELNVRK